MKAIKAIKSRRTIRDFSEKKIPSTVLQEVMDAGLRAPSNDHMRSWEFVLVNSLEKRHKLVSVIDAPRDRKGAEEVLNAWGLSNPTQREMYLDGIPRQHSMLISCSDLIIPCFKNSGDLLKHDSLSSLNAFASIWCCVENMLIAASARGIYGVTRIPFEKEILFIREELGVPSEYHFPCYLALGYPHNSQKIKQIEVNVSDRIHVDRW